MAKDPSLFKSVESLLKGVENGDYVIPNFQRKFEWKPGDVRDLLVSIMQDYFTGLLLFWELPEHLSVGEWDPLWGAEKPDNPFYAILDGQQRLSSLYYAIYGPEKHFPQRSTYYMFYLKLDEYLDNNFEDAVTYKFSKSYNTLENLKDKKFEFIDEKVFPLPLLQDTDFLNNEFNDWVKRYTEQFVEKGKDSESYLKEFIEVNNRILGIRNILNYKFVTHTLSKDRDLSDICGIFAKINQTGMRLSTFDLMNAFLFPKGIMLRNLWENEDKEQLKKVDRNMNEYLLKLISLYKQDYCSSKYIFYLIPGFKVKKRTEIGKITLIKDSDEFIKLWNMAYKFANECIDNIMNVGNEDFGAIKYDFIPNKTIIPVMSAVLWKSVEYKNVDQKKVLKLINRWYWHATISGDYSGSSDSVMSEDYRDFKLWFSEQDDSVIRRINKLNVDDINDLDLRSVNKGSALYNVILSLLALKGAKDFYKSRPLGSGGYQGVKIHDHHIFPKNVKIHTIEKSTEFKKTNDSILNRTLLLDKTNERIKNNKPSSYLKEVDLPQERFVELMKTHFISENALVCLQNDDYNCFINEREKTIKKSLINLLNIKKIKSYNDSISEVRGSSLNDSFWNKTELVEYLNQTTPLQKLFLAAIVQSDDAYSNIKEVITIMESISKERLEGKIKNINGLKIAGAKSGLTSKIKRFGSKEDIIITKETSRGIEYQIKADYNLIIENWIKKKNLWIKH